MTQSRVSFVAVDVFLATRLRPQARRYLSHRRYRYHNGRRGAACVDIGSRRELFVDDFLVERLGGTATIAASHPEPRRSRCSTTNPGRGAAAAIIACFKTAYRLPDVLQELATHVTPDKLNTGEHSALLLLCGKATTAFFGANVARASRLSRFEGKQHCVGRRARRLG